MILATVSKPKQLLCLSFIGSVSVEELEQSRNDNLALLADLSSGFRLLVDLSQLEGMDTKCAGEIGSVMELLDKYKVGVIVRIIPNPMKDIGFNILSLFHYRSRPKIVTCKSLMEAGEVLGLGGCESP